MVLLGSDRLVYGIASNNKERLSILFNEEEQIVIHHSFREFLLLSLILMLIKLHLLPIKLYIS